MPLLKPCYYSIRHVTRFRYSVPVSESLMEIRMHPRDETMQRCLQFSLVVQPRATVLEYRDYLGNFVNHFDVPGRHAQLLVVAEALVEVLPQADLPLLCEDGWAALDELVAKGDYSDMLAPSYFPQPTPLLKELARELKAERRSDPLTLMRELNEGVGRAFEYVPKSTKVDSPIDEALRNRKGVCQDFAHVLIALAREVGIPARYVSGYLHHSGGEDRSSEGATHAWIEVLMPEAGWVGLDPTNRMITGDRHIRTAIGRDYADVPPTKGVFKGSAESELSVSVRVSPSDAPIQETSEPTLSGDWSTPQEEDFSQQQEQQQQQQQ